MNRAAPTEYAEYYGKYINQLPDGEVIKILKQQNEETLQLLQTVSEEKAHYRYAPDKWSIKQVVGHLVDVERVFAFRALCFSRNDKGPFPGMDQNQYADGANFDERTLQDICNEFRYIRLSSIALFSSFSDDMFDRKGVASGCEFTVRAIPFIVAGHELHHVKILKERYLS